MRTYGSDQPTNPQAGGDIFALGFGGAISIAALFYFLCLPGVGIPGWVALAVMLALMALFGYIAGKKTARGATAGLLVGLLTAALNVVSLGSLATKHGEVFGMLAGGILLAGGGGYLGSRAARPVRDSRVWTPAFAIFTLVGALMLLIIGGVVTSAQAGLAVPDWPRTFEHNMFLYPFSEMTGGVYFEHAHRLMGALVGLATVALAVHVWFADDRGGVRLFGLILVALVIVQGYMGGARVTEQSLFLAAVHGVNAQVFFALLMVMYAVQSSSWVDNPAPLFHPSAGFDRKFAGALLAICFAQVCLGAAIRHYGLDFMHLLHLHLTIAIGLLVSVVILGLRAGARYPARPRLKKVGRALLGIVGTQALLGFAAWGIIAASKSNPDLETAKLFVRTAHQAMGAVLFSHLAMFYAFTRRLIAPAG